MLHACVERFDVTVTVRKILGTKRRLTQNHAKCPYFHCRTFNSSSGKVSCCNLRRLPDWIWTTSLWLFKQWIQCVLGARTWPSNALARCATIRWARAAGRPLCHQPLHVLVTPLLLRWPVFSSCNFICWEHCGSMKRENSYSCPWMLGCLVWSSRKVDWSNTPSLTSCWCLVRLPAESLLFRLS